MQMPVGEYIYYALYAVILVVFFIVLKSPKKDKGEQKEKKKFVSTSKKFNKNIEDKQDMTEEN